MLPAPAPEPLVHRNFEQRVFPGEFPLTAEVVATLEADYDFADASVRSLSVRPESTGPRVQLTLAAPRRFVPSTGYVAVDGSRNPWPPALLRFSLVGVTELRFDAADRIGATITGTAEDPAVAIGRHGSLRGGSASVWPDDPRWFESSAGRAADQVTPRTRPDRRPGVATWGLTKVQSAAARAIQLLMIQIRLVHYYPELAARIPVAEICQLAAGAGGDILAAAARRGSARNRAFAELAQRWSGVPGEREPAAVPSGPTLLRYVGFRESHRYYDVHRDGSVEVIAAVPDAEPAAPWRLVSDVVAVPTEFRIAGAAFDGVRQLHRDGGAITIADDLRVSLQ